MTTQPSESFVELELAIAVERDVPAWSGKFIEFIPRTVGLVMIHADDTKTYPPPPGWRYTRDEPVYVNDVELWPLAHEEAEDEELFNRCFPDFLRGIE